MIHAAPAHGAPLAVWGGFECSVIRVGDTWRDQCAETGHASRPTDLDRAAALGIRTLRYPLVWERVAAEAAAGQPWAWHDARIARLQSLGIDVIAGLLHHGSGPPGTHLLDPQLPALLARHAAAAARRYPHIRDWTPVNEPLTTARFSCLYGHWFPHLTETSAFLRATALQCTATLHAMRAIRAQSPHARLVQTEDLGRTFATAPLRAQAEYENQRRWLSLDLLCGRVDRTHPWRTAFEQAGVPTADLDELATAEATPDLIGCNYYVTSERFLDHQTALYPPHLRGGNGHASYADTEAVRVPLPPGLIGWLPRLAEAWQRYRLPLAVTEAQLGCDDDAEQARWFLEAWHAAQTLRASGADIRAVTAWALAGSVDWDSLTCQQRGRAELGAWNLATTPPQPRLLATLLADLTRTGACTHPALQDSGWWQRDARIVRRRA